MLTQNAKASADLLREGLARHQAGQLGEAMAAYTQVLLAEPFSFGANHFKGVIQFQQKEYGESIDCIRRAIEINPRVADAYSNLGLALHALARYEEALANFDAAIAINSGFAQAHNNRGNALVRLERPLEAIASYKLALTLQGNNPETFYSLGKVQQDCMLLDEALVSHNNAIALNPRYAQAFNNRGNVLKGLDRAEEAISSFKCALDITPGYASAYVNMADAYLLGGDYESGWKHYERRWQNDDQGTIGRNFSKPLWFGAQDISNSVILLRAEQGLGDSVQFCRFASLVAGLGAKVLLKVPTALMGFMQTLPGIDAVVEQDAALPDFDFHCPLLSLPLAFATRIESIPCAKSYLRCSPKKLQFWEQRMPKKTMPRVGLVWSGNPSHKADGSRSLRLSELLAYLPQGVQYVSLQKEVRDADRAALEGSSLVHFASELQDFEDTAALCELMDVVISVDTSVAHLAGALGRPTWILLSYHPDWRWMCQRDDSPWYASAKLYRQAEPGIWASALVKASNDLRRIML